MKIFLSFRAIWVIPVLAGLVLAGPGCHNSSQSPSLPMSDSEKVVAIHATLMTLHEQIMDSIVPERRLKRLLVQKMESLALKGGDTLPFSRLATTLYHCDTAMFGWMKRYDGLMTGRSDSMKILYLDSQIDLVGQVGQTMDSAMVMARRQTAQ